MTIAMVDQQSHMPISTTQLVGHGISTVVGGLTPTALGILLLNILGVAAAVYFLNILIRGQQAHLEQLLATEQAQLEKVLSVTQAQMNAVLKTHDREFDALMAMLQKASEPPPEFLPPPRPP